MFDRYLISLAAVIIWLLYVGYVGICKIDQWRFLFKGRQMIRAKAMRAGNAPFSLPIFGYGDRMHIVSTEQHWVDMKSASVGHLSLHHWVKSMFQPKYSLIDEWPDNREDEGMPVIRAIRTMSNHLPELKPKLLEIFERDLNIKIQTSAKVDGFSRVPLLETVEYLMVRINTLFILGESAVNDLELINRGIAYTKEVTMIGEAVRLVPTCFASLVSKMIKGRNKNQKHVLESLIRLVDRRRELRKDVPKSSLPAPKTVLEAFVDFSPDSWTTREIVHHFNILWTTTTLSIGVVATQFVQDLFSYTSYTPALLEEFHNPQGLSSPPRAATTSLIEGFLMESMRMNCFQSTACHRTALSPFTFSDGYTIPEGESVQFYQEKVHFDENRYHESNTFNPRRYQGSRRAATDVGMEWPFWGVGKNACPGRFHFSYTIKVFAEYLLTQFDCKFESSKVGNFTWGENSVPSSGTVLLMKKRTAKET